MLQVRDTPMVPYDREDSCETSGTNKKLMAYALTTRGPPKQVHQSCIFKRHRHVMHSSFSRAQRTFNGKRPILFTLLHGARADTRSIRGEPRVLAKQGRFSERGLKTERGIQQPTDGRYKKTATFSHRPLQPQLNMKRLTEKE